MKKEKLETGLIGGIEHREIKMLDYDAVWPAKFQKHASMIKEVLGNTLVRIEHIGSTAVPQLAAKPIIDILLILKDASDESLYLKQMEFLDYVLRVREPDFNEHRMFRTKDLDVHIHVFSEGCVEIERYLTFRDRLRKYPDERQAYEKLKRALAENHWNDMNCYAEAKTEIIERIIADARSVGEISK